LSDIESEGLVEELSSPFIDPDELSQPSPEEHLAAPPSGEEPATYAVEDAVEYGASQAPLSFRPIFAIDDELADALCGQFLDPPKVAEEANAAELGDTSIQITPPTIRLVQKKSKKKKNVHWLDGGVDNPKVSLILPRSGCKLIDGVVPPRKPLTRPPALRTVSLLPHSFNKHALLSTRSTMLTSPRMVLASDRNPEAWQVGFPDWGAILVFKRGKAASVIRAVKKESLRGRPSEAELARDPDHSYVRKHLAKAVLSELGRSSGLTVGWVAPEYQAREDWWDGEQIVDGAHQRSLQKSANSMDDVHSVSLISNARVSSSVGASVSTLMSAPVAVLAEDVPDNWEDDEEE
jgi:hypothetical protein